MYTRAASEQKGDANINVIQTMPRAKTSAPWAPMRQPDALKATD